MGGGKGDDSFLIFQQGEDGKPGVGTAGPKGEKVSVCDCVKMSLRLLLCRPTLRMDKFLNGQVFVHSQGDYGPGSPGPPGPPGLGAEGKQVYLF